MAKIEDLVAQITDAGLRKALVAEVKALKKVKKFGLVFEEHLPETVRLPQLRVTEGSLVTLKAERANKPLRVDKIQQGMATCSAVVFIGSSAGETSTVEIDELVRLGSFGDPIYPSLVQVGTVKRNDTRPWHVLINADNYHALQLLLYAYEGKVDLIYIDPPYNTGAKDWKYNNDYVDQTDAFRHSKWLSMMKKRLLLARRLLTQDGVLIVTIDEHEVHHLGNLLEDVFPEASQQLVTIVINQKGVAQGRLARVEEYASFVFMPNATIPTHHDDLLSPDRSKQKGVQTPRWERLLRGGNNSKRSDRPGLFYPIFIDPKTKSIKSVGEPLSISDEPDLSRAGDGTVAWPLRSNGAFGNWQAKPSTLRALIKLGYVRVSGFDKKRKTWTILYLNRGTRARIDDGDIKIVSRDAVTGSVTIEYATSESRKLSIKTVWHRGTHDSGIYGSSVLRTLIGGEAQFAFPKSIYAVRDAIGAVVRKKPAALIVDFFAGSGTTLHATALLNAEDEGQRRCIVVTNNEVEAKLAARLEKSGIHPGDPEFEKHGIAEAIAWPRCQAALLGKRPDGEEVSGEYLTGRKMSEGFQDNLTYFRLDFVDPAAVARGDSFQAILPILWLIANCTGEPGTSRGASDWYFPKSKQACYAVLLREKLFPEFRKRVNDTANLKWVFLVTDSEENFATMRRLLGRKYICIHLYKSYLENFRLSTQSSTAVDVQ